ncbi:uncharacterized protein LOC110991029 isoform X2 [Acanthaster planci]|nr:uncharacterized protein LOC110991029 isoform X2 [Acanthaster planci]XP_022111803.1 uncharacterized protein LOC110991029 isoform X2 [Acanthaster planci]
MGQQRTQTEEAYLRQCENSHRTRTSCAVCTKRATLSMKTILLLSLTLLIVEARLEWFSWDWNVTLAGGPHGYEGRLEMRPPDDIWGTVCDRNSTAVAHACPLAVVRGICSRMGFLAPYSLSYAGERFGKADKPIWSQGFTCTYEKPGDLCSFAAWSLHPTSCDHSSDLALLCIPPTFRLSAGCSPREGRVEVSVGTAGWAWLARCRPQDQQADIDGDLYEADLICRHFGYKLALGLGGVCTNETREPTLQLMTTRCGYAYHSWTECLRHTLMDSSCENRTPSCAGTFKEVMCASDEEMVAISNTRLYGLNVSVRLVDGLNDREGILELQFNGTGWGPACLHDGNPSQRLAKDVCYRIGASCLIKSHFLSAEKRGKAVEYLLRKKHQGSFFWFRLQNQCWRTGGHYMRISCSLEITMHGLAGSESITPEQTCVGRCGERSSPVQCGCDVIETFQDCCYDVARECSTSLEWLSSNYTRHDPDLFLLLLDNLRYYQCWSLDSSQNLKYQLVSECPDSWGEDEVRRACLLPSNVNPVLYRSLVPFKNVACAICHGATAASSFDSNATKVPNEFLLPVPLFDYEKTLRLCPSTIGTCPTYAYGYTEACESYMAPHKNFKNPHCAKCNLGQSYEGVCDDNQGQSVMEGLMLIHKQFPSVTPQRVNHHTVTVDPADLSTRMFTTHLHVTAANEGAQNTNESIRSGVDSAKCLLQAIGYSNLGLALHFLPSLQQLLKSELVYETVDTAFSLTTSYLESTSQLEGVLDDVLSLERIRPGTDWVGRCNLAEVLVSDKSNLQMTPNSNTSSSGDVDCFDVNRVNVTPVNISGNLFLFIASAPTLVSSTYRNTSIVYQVRAETTEKFKLVNYCGIKENNITCEIQAKGNEKIHDPDVPTEVTLLSGETLICFSTIRGSTTGDPFSFDDPAQVLNVVAFSLSMAGILATLITYGVFPTLRNVPGLAIMSLSLAILAGQLLAILSTVVIGPSDGALCITVAVVSHYMWLATFAWMAVMSWDLMRTFTTTTSAKTAESRSRFLRLCLIGWCAPLLFVTPNLILHFTSNRTRLVFGYGGQVSCWLVGRGSAYVMFYAPIALCICFNVACFACTIRGIRASKKASTILSKKGSRAKAVWQELVVYLKISSLMSFAWILGFVTMATGLVVFRYLFIIFCSLQGVFVFLSFAFSRQARTLWRKKLVRPAVATARGPYLSNAQTTPVTKTTSLG